MSRISLIRQLVILLKNAGFGEEDIALELQAARSLSNDSIASIISSYA